MLNSAQARPTKACRGLRARARARLCVRAQSLALIVGCIHVATGGPSPRAMDFGSRYDAARYSNASQFAFGEGSSQFAFAGGAGGSVAGHGGSPAGVGSSYGGGSGGPGGGYAGHGSSVITINCPKDRVGRICGPRGSRIQEIRQRSHARIDIENQCAPGTDFQVIRISGPEESIRLAANLVSDATCDLRSAICVWREQRHTCLMLLS